MSYPFSRHSVCSPRASSARFADYLTYRIDNKVKIEKPGQAAISGTKAWSTVKGWCWDLTSLGKHKASPRMSQEDLAVFTESLRQHAQQLKIRYKLRPKPVKAIRLGRSEIKLMITTAFDFPESWDVALQDALLVLTFSYIGCRPGSVLPTALYTYFVPWKNISAKPIYRPGTGQDAGKMVLDGYWVIVRLDTFKGYQYLQSLDLEYVQVSPF